MSRPALLRLALASLALAPTTLAQSRSNPASTGGTATGVYLAGTVTTFLSQADFAAAAGDTTLVDFEAFADGTEINGELSMSGVTSVTGTSTNELPAGPTTQFIGSSLSLPFPMYNVGTLPSETNFISNRLNPGVYATGTILFEFDAPRTAVGAYWVDAVPLGDSIIEIFDQAGVSLGTAFRPGGGVLPDSFLGLVSSAPFWSAEFRSAHEDDSWGLDDLEFNNADLGTGYCVSTVNSTGSAALISAAGSTSVAQNLLTLSATPVPDQPGLFFYGPNQDLIPFGNGFRCVSGLLVRLNPPAPATGNTATRNVDLVFQGITAGQTWNFQYWFRDPLAAGSNFNLSDGRELVFVP